MLDLASPRWEELDHAYGPASDVPALLSRVSRQNLDAIDELTGSICHQGSTYDASIAAFPHLVAIASSSTPEFRANVLILVGAIHWSDDYRGEGLIPPDIRKWYRQCLPTARKLVADSLATTRDRVVSIYLLAAATALHGHRALGRGLDGLVDGEFYVTCPKCSALAYVWRDGDVFFLAAQDPIRNSSCPRHAIVPTKIDPPVTKAQRLLTKLTEAPFLAEIRDQIGSLFGTATCPACDVKFCLANRLGRT